MKSKIKQAIKEEAKEISRRIWEQSPQKGPIVKFDESYLFKEYHKLTDSLSRQGTALLTQIRTGHIPTNANENSLQLTGAENAIPDTRKQSTTYSRNAKPTRNKDNS